MYHVNEFNSDRSEVTAAYTAEDFPVGQLVGCSGNAVLIKTTEGWAVVSRPRSEGPILPTTNLDWAWGE
jgi:hypothetical protein